MIGIIYSLHRADNSIDEFYLGSTMNLNARISKHRYSCNKPCARGYNYPVYRFIRDNGGFDAWTCDIIEIVEVKDEEELRVVYEKQYQLELKPELNVRQEGRTKEEMKQFYKAYYKAYYKENKADYQKRSKKYYLKKKGISV